MFIRNYYQSFQFFNNIFKAGTMHSLKGLIPKQVLNDQAFLPIYKKAEEHKKAAQICIDFFQQINKFFQNFSGAIEKCLQDCDIQNVQANYYILVSHVCAKLLIENKQLTQNTKGSSKQLTKVCNAILDDFSKYLQNFQSNIRKYQQNQIIIQEMCKKYSRSHKNMLGSIQAYKASLTDVTLIYNIQQKNRRYQTCDNNYKVVVADYTAISEKSEALSQRKAKIVGNYQQLRGQFTNVIKLIGSKVIGQTKNFVSYYCATTKTISAFLAQQKYNLERERLDTFLWNFDSTSNIQLFDSQRIAQVRGKKKNIPLIFQYPQFIKQQYLQNYNGEMIFYLKKVQEGIDKRKQQNKKIYELFVQYFKIIEKVHIVGVKQIVQNFDKLKKKLVQSFGPRLASFMKCINAIFQLLSGINQKLIKNTSSQLSSLQTMLNQQSKYLKLFNEELKTNIEKFIGKKELKKLKEDQFTQQTSVTNMKMFRKEVQQKAQFFKHLITGFQDKMFKNCQKISTVYTNLIQSLTQTINQFYSLSCQYQQLYFGPEEFSKNFQIYEYDVQALVEKNKVYFQQLALNILKDDHTKISFDGDYNKIEQFKKLKKPNSPNQALANSAQKQTQVKQIKQQKQPTEPKSPKSFNNDDANQSTKNQTINNQNVQTQVMNKKNSSKDINNISDQKQLKNYEFLLTKLQLKQNEQYIKSFSCAMSEKIVLQGRIYITTERICFSSGFNSSNLFFGKTFIEFPKQDIIKVEKKQNSLLIDNSISFTTNKGQLYFTSFFSRNEAYDLICRTFELSLDEHVYQFKEETEKQEPQVMVEVKEQDDIKQSELETRNNQINAILFKFPYNEINKISVQKQGLTAFQIFKIFYSNNQITISRRKYLSFLIYTKQLLSHKDVEIDQWSPGLPQLINTSNIKSPSPLKTVRKIRATVPVANSGIPFMPKTTKSQQIQTLYFFSKHKWILESEITSTGAPYTDTFKLQLRTTVTSDQKAKCQITIGLYINFVKNTMMKSVIESKSHQESVKATKVSLQQIKKYFIALAKSQNMPKKSQNITQQLKQIKAELQTKNNQLDNTVKQKQNLSNQLTKLKQLNQKYKKIIFVLASLILVLIVLLLS